MNTETVHLRAEIPDVEVESAVLRVRCGESVCYVKEHGREGSGAWAAWTDGHVLRRDFAQRPEPGTAGYTKEMALRDATAEVQRRERSRLLHSALTDTLEAAP